MMRAMLALLLTTVMVGCIGGENRSIREAVQIVRSCIDAQVRIGNPSLDPSSGAPNDERVNTVIIRDIPNASVYILELGASPSYPDAPIAMCYFDHGDEVTRALYQMPGRTPKESDVVFRVQSMFENVSDDQANEYLLQTRYQTLPLSDVIGLD